MPVVDYYRQHGKVVEVSRSTCSRATGANSQVDSSPSVEIVYEKVRTAIDPRLPTPGLAHNVPLQNAALLETAAPTV